MPTALLLAAAVALAGPAPRVERLRPADIDAAIATGLPSAPIVDLPTLDGIWLRFELSDAGVMHPDLATRFPEVRAYVGRGVDDASALASLVRSPLGIHALVINEGRASLVSSVPGSPDVVSVQPPAPGAWECLASGADREPARPPAGYSPRGPASLRTYRFAAACTGEFGVHASTLAGHAPNTADALAAIVVMTARTSLITERDLGVRLELVANNDLLVFLDPATDPYPVDSSNSILSANPGVVNARIGSASYDLGHAITRIPGGVAYLSAACTTSKAGGVSGTPRTDTGDPLDPQILMHEVGHQLGANHTFNGIIDRCAGNRAAHAAHEPGSGTTIMSYAGGCPVGNVPPGDNISITRDLMYHAYSIEESRWAFPANCGTNTLFSNSLPTLAAFPPVTGLAVPRETPFTLAALASDADGDSLTYSWEQHDLGSQTSLADPDNGASPLFRTFPPAGSGSRTFPALGDVRSGLATRGERLPTVANVTRTFRLAVRDQHPGGVAISPVVSVFVANAGTFAVTAPSEGERLPAGPALVRWSVAGTDSPPLSASSVRILLSTDDGLTFPTVLATDEPNDGQADITLPPTATTGARLMIRPEAGIFFAMSRPFSIAFCDPDANADGNVDQGDVDYLVNLVAGGANPTGFDADFNRDGNADQGDVGALINVVAGGPCP